MRKKLKNSFRAAGCGNARFLSLRAFRDDEDLARREHAAILAFRGDLAAGMPLEDAESFLRMDLHELAIDDEGYIQGIITNPSKDPVNLYGFAADFVEA